MSIEFVISAWRAWAPGLSDAADWQRWRLGEASLVEGDQPDVSFLPAMQRRRLSPLAKAAFATAYPLLHDRDIPLLCCSVHGEALRTFSLLRDVASGESLSPTAFGLSVHNAIAGQLSILCGIHSPALALAGGDFPLQAGLLEAAGLLAEGAQELVLLFCEEPLPEMYLASAQSAQSICATALHLTATASSEQGLRAALAPGAPEQVESAFARADYQLPLIAALTDGAGRVPVGQGWELCIHG
ncbi:Beta-ketoacyl synthase, N-terminal domain [Microbulbifer donghaiensis]|uniref:Beta-ketoacyl synthase, N-terminal domain n=1 Tax=Microbulbifer donghaiensis TaxID=494016 RepID=A0A1M5AZU5_9GAMM|nr:beta-ketoacyl synthase chain length factor [Microbulbifer donghaiensis]SHF35723.1 Beta-ketoacyl synthase, N-terminal domain [Microbulbifer donghaiensis]